jgi:hypothetical protein
MKLTRRIVFHLALGAAAFSNVSRIGWAQAMIDTMEWQEELLAENGPFATSGRRFSASNLLALRYPSARPRGLSSAITAPYAFVIRRSTKGGGGSPLPTKRRTAA